MSDLILPEHMAKARRKEKAKIAEKGKTAAEIEQKQKEVEDIYGERESKYIDPDNIDTSVAEKLPKPTESGLKKAPNKSKTIKMIMKTGNLRGCTGAPPSNFGRSFGDNKGNLSKFK